MNTINLPDINIHNREQVTATGTDEILIADASDGFKLKKALVSTVGGGGGGGTPGGAEGDVQYNASGAFAGESTFNYNQTTNTLTVANLALTTALPIAQGGTGSTSASAARTALGVNYGLNTIWIPAQAMRPSNTGGCAPLALVTVAADRPDISSLDFDATTAEYAQFSVRFPKGWNEGTVQAIFHWSHASTTTNFGVMWDIQAVAISDNDSMNTAYGTAVGVADTGGTTNNLYVTAATSAITIAGTPAVGDQVHFRVFRDPADAADTMAIDARLMGVTILYTIDTLDDT